MVAKFGGTSVQDATAIVRVADIVTREQGRAKAQGAGYVVVLSAMGGVTDLLLGAAKAATRGDSPAASWEDAVASFRRRHLDAVAALITGEKQRSELLAYMEQQTRELHAICASLAVLREATPRILDLTAARGERCLARLFTALLDQGHLAADYVDATEIIQVERHYGSPFPDLTATAAQATSKIRPLLAKGRIVVMPGFFGRGQDGELVTLGRGGSDLSATVLAHALSAQEVTLWKEVDGLMTADPRAVHEARVVPELHYREAAELAYYGAKVLHPRTIVPLIPKQIPLMVRSSFRPEQAGTRIAGDVPPGAFPVKALTGIKEQSLVTIAGGGMIGVPGMAARTFGALAQAGISVTVISQASSEASICLVVPTAETPTALKVLRDAFHFEAQHKLIDDISAKNGQAVIAVVGLGMAGTPGMAARAFNALSAARVNAEAIAQGSSELNISVVVAESGLGDALCALHREFRLEKLRALPAHGLGDVRYALLGAGQIGRALLRQLIAQRSYFKDKMGIDLRCLGLTDRSGLVMRDDGYSDQELGELLARKEGGRSLHHGSAAKSLQLVAQELATRLWQLPVRRGVFVDVTAEESAPLLESALSAGWHVVVANKKPLAVDQEQFDQLFATAAKHGVSLRYEATVGAGLPILDTLAKLEEAGDEVQTILGCFSGTLGFLMTEVMAGTHFSEAVRRAHALGYTEPDPREDLSGMDVGRKALILARTLGLRLNLADIAVESLFPAALSAADPETFLTNLKSLDGQWAERVARAHRDRLEIRYVASISRDRVTVGLQEVSADSPLGRLRGTDNQVTVTSRRYASHPLIVSGPGAGAEVTAAGVLNDILAIATAAERNPLARGRAS